MKKKKNLRAQLRKKFRKFFTESERKTKLYKRIRTENADNLEKLLDEAEQMEAWCAKKRKNFSLLRFNRWLKNSEKWKKEREKQEKQNESLEEYERRKTQELLKSRE